MKTCQCRALIQHTSHKPPSDITRGLANSENELFTAGGFGPGTTRPPLSGHTSPLEAVSLHMEVESSQGQADNHGCEAADPTSGDEGENQQQEPQQQ